MNEVEPRTITIDALILANSAEMRDGLLYSLGGGWTRCWPGSGEPYPVSRVLPVVLLLRVPWADANQEHTFTVSVRDSDEKSIVRDGTDAQGSFKVGRDISLLDGMSQVVGVVIPAHVVLPAPGIYQVVAAIDGIEHKRIEFEALAAAPGAPRR